MSDLASGLSFRPLFASLHQGRWTSGLFGFSRPHPHASLFRLVGAAALGLLSSAPQADSFVHFANEGIHHLMHKPPDACRQVHPFEKKLVITEKEPGLAGTTLCISPQVLIAFCPPLAQEGPLGLRRGSLFLALSVLLFCME